MALFEDNPIVMISNSLGEREVTPGVFLIYDITTEVPNAPIGSVFTDSHRPGGWWQYWSKDSDMAGAPSKEVAIQAMQAAIAIRALDVEKYRDGYRYRINLPTGPVYAKTYAWARVQVLRGWNANIVEFNRYGGTYHTPTWGQTIRELWRQAEPG